MLVNYVRSKLEGNMSMAVPLMLGVAVDVTDVKIIDRIGVVNTE